MIKVIQIDGSAIFLNPAWIEAFRLIFSEDDGTHFTRVTMHQASARAHVDTNESPEDLAERINALRTTSLNAPASA